MAMRYNEPGWIKITRYDTAKRRALWARVSASKIEFCAGREGDDAYAKICFYRLATLEELYSLIQVIEAAIYGMEI